MTQEQYTIITKIITNGAPALAAELCGALNQLIQRGAELEAENIALKENKETEVNNG